MDVVVEATGVTEVGARVAYESIQEGKHVVMLNAEADATVGAILARMARSAGVVYTGSAGDEPAAVMELYDFARSMGFEVVAVGKGKNNPLNLEATPDLLTAFYTLTNLVGEERVHRVAHLAASNIFTRYTLLPLMAVFFLTNPMCYTFGTFLDERYKPAFYDAAVSMVHPPLGLFPHVNSAELFVWLGVAAGIQQLGLPIGDLAIRYLLAGICLAFLRGVITQYVTVFLARRQGVEI